MEEAFKIFKDKFISALILTYFDPDKETIIKTDALDFINNIILY